MSELLHSATSRTGDLSLEDFVADSPWDVPPPPPEIDFGEPLIDGVTAHAIAPHADSRGALVELLSARDGLEDPVVHVYEVTAAPGSVRAWIYHREQKDRLAYASGEFELALFDLRRDSPTHGLLQVLAVGAAQPALVTIPPFVVHGLRNRGSEPAHFVNLPTRVYDLSAPDKHRLPADDPRIPYRFT